ncbi:MAG: hypothetical protein MI924_33050 [Chloroflexales bacterium]|nr:hypothetical protein [Chloroflexales bacterium]
MASNVDPIVQQIQQDFQTLLTYVSGPEAQSQTAFTVERLLFRQLLALGAALLRLFFLSRAAVRSPHRINRPCPTTISGLSPTIRSLANAPLRGTTSIPLG